MTLLALALIAAFVIVRVSAHRRTFERGKEEGRRLCLIDENFRRRSDRRPD